VSGILGCQLFANEDVAQMGPTAAAGDLCPASISIQVPGNRTLYFVIKAGPAAAGVEFINRAVQQGVAAFTMVVARFKEVVVLPAEGPFCALAEDDPFFFRGEIAKSFFHIESLILLLSLFDQLLADAFQGQLYPLEFSQSVSASLRPVKSWVSYLSRQVPFLPILPVSQDL
jgi:hypothetical protein